ncbi:MAG: alpha/beta fold hydrolase, partial [Flavobacterium sp.]|nr:alpha/beta fold hydrolase [Flavobacterium sp.]
AAVILISGSGPQNRNEELLGHKPFLVLADYLTKNGIAVLRFDDRGVGKSGGDFKTATSADFSTDVESAFAYLKTRSEINSNKIGLIGHSEGGIIAPMIAAKNNEINFIVLLAAPSLKGDKLLLLQKEKIESAMNISESEIKKGQEIFSKLYKMMQMKHEDENIKSYLKTNLASAISEDAIDGIVKQLDSNWMQYYINYDPIIALSKVKCPVLALNGENDLQVPFKENLTGIKKAISKAKNPHTQFKSYQKLNHLFQTSVTGSPTEYQNIEETFAPVVLKDISDWILQVTR